jgi:hypothetical protein
MPNFNGLWTKTQQMQASSVWPRTPNAPTGISATISNSRSVVSFTAPTDIGYPAGITSYRVTANPGNITAVGTSSPITITGLTNDTNYTISVCAINLSGNSPESSTVSVTPVNLGQVLYNTAGTYSWVAPTGVTSISVVAVGAGGGGYVHAGGGGGLRYYNNLTVTPGSSYTITVGLPGGSQDTNINGGNSSFAASLVANGGASGNQSLSRTGTGGTGTSIGGSIGGGNGGTGSLYNGSYRGGGGGAGGYAGAGGNGTTGGTATAGAGGGAGGGYSNFNNSNMGAGGGVGIYGQGANGAAGTSNTNDAGGKGGSGGANGAYQGGSDAYKGGYYGGGASGDGAGGVGAVRIIWGPGRSFPSTNTTDL